MVHREQVILPETVEHTEHDHALVIAHGLFADDLLLGGVPLLQLFKDRLAQFVAGEFIEVYTLRDEIEAKLRPKAVLDPASCPTGRGGVSRGANSSRMALSRFET